jgi:hypothetical protein
VPDEIKALIKEEVGRDISLDEGKVRVIKEGGDIG